MSDAAHKLHQDYWRPPQPSGQRELPPSAPVRPELACQQCGTEFIVGARYCHVCGNEREPMPGFATHRWTELLDFTRIRETVGLPTVSLIAFIFGVACIVAAVATGFIFTASTMLDWQAVQVWRIEWLLAAAASFLAGILLKKNEPR